MRRANLTIKHKGFSEGSEDGQEDHSEPSNAELDNEEAKEQATSFYRR